MLGCCWGGCWNNTFPKYNLCHVYVPSVKKESSELKGLVTVAEKFASGVNSFCSVVADRGASRRFAGSVSQALRGTGTSGFYSHRSTKLRYSSSCVTARPEACILLHKTQPKGEAKANRRVGRAFALPVEHSFEVWILQQGHPPRPRPPSRQPETLSLPPRNRSDRTLLISRRPAGDKSVCVALAMQEPGSLYTPPY